ncbi:MAG: hypothetical protein CME43_14560 [Haliea sp.]|uniref:hypothetical protein n=1 Tax=Haliea sp. TaxID=1932666 RepID=UPI000C4F232C|nr:hypothetical protein [Haliea sp.]MBM70687.1 hypothetical protein [Haliea sp.]|tara:strand:+ start:3610 stop:4458 length:849 start_codon:yes stop_codon:yes gene_type:complete
MSLQTAQHALAGILCLPLLLPSASRAQLPLNIEELLVAPNTLTLQTLFSYSSTDRPLSGAAPGAFPVPAANLQTRSATALTRLRYGVGRSVEINADLQRTRVDWQQPAASGGGDEYALGVGASWLLSPDTETPALLLSGGVDALATSWLAPGERYSGKALRAGAHLYRALDPVVLSLALSYEWRRPRPVGVRRYDPGDILRLQPQVNFAVNPRVTLIGGLSWQYVGRERLDTAPVAGSLYQTGLTFGLGLQAGPGSIIFVDTRVATSGGRGASLGVDWHYQF